MGKHLRITTCRGLYVARIYALFPARFRYNQCHRAVEHFSSKQAHSTFHRMAQSYTLHHEPALCSSHMNLIMATAALACQ